ncbi:hypothetical protein Dester_0128 [Desulfurobacterium thermolithotrophum DSM 11699]|uniref:Uncharacterized protein n=1 Tax=Desulfurobacterium thermolithotrophum (strain DSM 11699 / BSA) TaxID=868864 RepID=F0S0Y2_DESTD|nr:hypothetical protein [Desulfurobacterium thermolithotrophum]ADY72786.1 hypothetical protein Dester_0128 [Desulfurobacterium thermolithotrophum DSM 11699]
MYKRLLKCSTCGNTGEFEYVGSRDVNKKGDVKDIIGNKEMWISYFKCPECSSIEVEFHPVGEKPDIPEEFFREVAVEEGNDR